MSPRFAITAVTALTLAFASPYALANNKRSHTARAAFFRTHPCPSTQAPRPPCPGWIIDHIIPLCMGGADAASNMQWQTRRESYIKDAVERRHCHAMKP